MCVMSFFGIATALLPLIKLCADEMPELAFNDTVVFVSVFNDMTADLDVFFERLVACIDHDTGESLIDAVFAQFKRVTVIQVHGNRYIGNTDRSLDQLLEVDGVCILAGPLGNLKHNWSLLLFARF